MRTAGTQLTFAPVGDDEENSSAAGPLQSRGRAGPALPLCLLLEAFLITPAPVVIPSPADLTGCTLGIPIV